MNLVSSVTSGLYGATLLARGRSEGLQYVESDLAGAARSFWALLVGMPAIICLRLISWLETGVPAHAGHGIAIDLLTYTVGWLGFAALSFHLVPMLGGGARWPRYIAAWNWCNVIENLLVMFGAIPGLLGAPPVIDEAAQMIAVGWALWIEWFATRQALGIMSIAAAILVVLDQLIGLLLTGLSLALTGH